MKIAIMANANEHDFKSRETKYLCEIIDKPMIAYPIQQAQCLSEEVYVVAREHEKLKAAVEKSGAVFVEESAAKSFFAQFADEPVLVIQGDELHIPTNMLSTLIRLHNSSDTPVTYVKTDDYILAHYHGLGEQLPPYITAANSFAPLADVLKAYPNAEAYAVPNYISERIVSRQDLSTIIYRISSENCEKHMHNGVSILDSLSFSAVLIGSDVIIEADAVIHPNVQITGKTHIGAGTVIRSGTRIHNMTIGADCEIEQSVLLESSVGNATKVGPFAYIRPGSDIGSHCRIGNFVEVKNSNIGDNSKAAHLSYIGDSDIGKNVNYACGCITANYDGTNKHRTTIEDDVFVGSNSTLIAPVRLGKNCFIAAGSTINQDVEPLALAIARERQVNKPNRVTPKK